MAFEKMEFLKTIKSVETVEIVGSIRRGVDYPSDVDLLVVTNDFGAIDFDRDKKAKDDPENVADCFMTDRRNYGASLVYTTGPHNFGLMLSDRMSKLGLDYDIPPTRKRVDFSIPCATIRRNGVIIPCQTEQEVFALAKLPYVPAALRDWLFEEITERGVFALR